MDLFAKEGIKLKKISPNRHLQNCLSIIYYVGLWSDQAKHKYLYNIYTACSLVFLLGINIASEIVYVVINWGNIEIMMACVTILITYSTYAAKVIYIIFQHKRIKHLIDITNSEMFSRDNDKYERIVTYYTWQGIFHHIAYQTFGVFAATSWGFTPILRVISRSARQLPTAGWYPYNVTSTPAFELTSFHQFVVVFTSCISNVAIDILITGLIVTTCCQLTLLNCNISSIVAERPFITSACNASAEKCAWKSYDELYENLKHCIRHSIMITDFSKQIQNMFGTLIFFQLLTNCIVVCLIAFDISQMKNYVASELLGTSLYMCCMTYQIFIYCWHGNELYLHSMNVCFSAYANDWWNNSKRFKQALLIIMTRAQWPFIFTVGSIMDLSLQNFVLILRTSYSIFTVLRTTTA